MRTQSLAGRFHLGASSLCLAAALCVAAMLGVSVAPARAAHFTIDPKADGNLVKFLSKAPAESFEGKSKQIAGSIDIDPTALGDSITVSVEVDVMTLDTGLALRNTHMRDNHLEPKKYPKIRFTGATLLAGHPGSLASGQTASLNIAGTFDLHGVQRRIEVPVEVTWDQAEKSLHVIANFQVKLADYQIPRPQFLVMKLDEVQRITFDVTAR